MTLGGAVASDRLVFTLPKKPLLEAAHWFSVTSYLIVIAVVELLLRFERSASEATLSHIANAA